jgi:hypothetical protein
MANVMIGVILMISLQNQVQLVHEYFYQSQDYDEIQSHHQFQFPQPLGENGLVISPMNVRFPSPVSVSNTYSNSNNYTVVVPPQKNKKRTKHHFTWPNISKNVITDLARSWWKKNKKKNKRDPLQDQSSKRHWWCNTQG